MTRRALYIAITAAFLLTLIIGIAYVAIVLSALKNAELNMDQQAVIVKEAAPILIVIGIGAILLTITTVIVMGIIYIKKGKE